jgi:hypothetical protein
MKTRLISVLVALMLTATFATAQDNGKMSFGILGGLNFQNLNGKDIVGDKLENDMKIGYHIGANVRIPIAPEFYFQPGILFSTKGAKDNSTSPANTINLSYIEMPLNLVYKGLLGTGYIILGLGPYFGYGIMGNVKSDDATTDIEFTNTVEITDPLTVPYFKAFDAGGNLFFGYELANGISAQMNVQLGMVKINPEYKILSEDKSSIKNTGFGISLGYRF